MYGTFYLGKNPNGKFFVTNVAQSVAQQLADENGTEFYEIVEGSKLTLKKVVLESGVEKPAKVEIKTLMVDGEPVKVQTSSQAEKQRVRDEKTAEIKAKAKAKAKAEAKAEG